MRKKILLLEDHLIHREVIYDGLEDAGFEVEKAMNREEAEAILNDERKRFKPDLFIIDIYLDTQKTGGIQFVQGIRKNPDYASVPILFISAHLDEIHRARFDHLVTLENTLPKPFDFEDLLGKIREVLKTAPKKDR